MGPKGKAQYSMDTKKIIIDTDCGSDDAMAIAMALNDPAYEIIMCTTVSGNVPMEQATINTLTTIEHAGTYEPPVYRGAKDMLLKKLTYAYETHGNDGMGDIGLKPERLTPTPGLAVVKMLEALRESEPGEIDIVALGPLTNIALALRLDPEAMERVGRIVIMGSAGLGRGNASPVAEFNVWQDAEAAKVVVESGLKDITFVGWDACLGEAMLSPDEIARIRESGPLGKFAIDCNKDLMAMNIDRFGEPCLDMADPSAMAAALYPECIDKCERYYCEVDTASGPSYGALLVDVTDVLHREPNVSVCSKLDAAKYKEYIYRTLGVKD